MDEFEKNVEGSLGKYSDVDTIRQLIDLKKWYDKEIIKANDTKKLNKSTYIWKDCLG